jgi:hypothetical protein
MFRRAICLRRGDPDSRTFHPSGPDFQNEILGETKMDLTTAYATKKVELINGDGTVRDVFTLPAAAEWPEVVIWGVADARRTFVRDRKGQYREATYAVAPMPPLQQFNGDWRY